MKKHFPLPIREDTFSRCWDYMDSRRRRIRIRTMTSALGGLFSNLVFLFSLFFGINGLILRYFSGSYCTYLQELSFFMGPWEQISRLFPAENTLGSNLLRLLFLSYLAGIAVFLILFLLITVLYHPRKWHIMEGDYPESARILAAVTKETWTQTFRTHISSSVISILLFIIGAFTLFFGYAFSLDETNAPHILLSQFPSNSAAINALLFVFFAYFIAHILCLPILLITRPLYYSTLPYTMVAETAMAARFAGEPVEGMSKEAILQRHRENAAFIREEGLRAEYQYRNEIAMDLYLKAALGGDVPAMEHYARHCLLSHQKEPACYWLDKAIASGEASPEDKNMLLRIRLGQNVNVGYLPDDDGNFRKTAQRRSAIQLRKSTQSLVVLLGITAVILAGGIRYFGEDTASLVTDLKNLSEILMRDTTVSNIPLQTLTEDGTPWEGACIAYDDTGAPMVSCYIQDQGGSLAVPFVFPEGEQLRSAELYFGNIWDVRFISNSVSYDAEMQSVIIAEEYLQSITPGEYFIILNKGELYIPLLINQSDSAQP